MHSDEESSPWDSPLTSARDPVHRKDVRATNTGPVPESLRAAVDYVEEKKGSLGNSDPAQKGNGSWIEIEHPSRRPSNRSDEAHRPSRKSPTKVISEAKNPPFEDFREALKSSTRQVVSDEETVAKPFPLPAKSQRETIYKIRTNESPPIEDVSTFSSTVLGNMGQSPNQKRHNSTVALFKAKAQSLEASPVPSKVKNKKLKETPVKQTQLLSTSSGGGGEGNSLQPKKRNSSLVLNETEVKFSGFPEHEEELKEYGHVNYGFNLEPVYYEPDADLEKKPVEVRIATDLASYKDDRHMYQFDYGHKDYYQAREEVEEAYMMKVADRSEKLIRRGFREVFGLLGIFANLMTVFLIELISFLSKTVFQVLAVGLLTVIGDHIIKPFLVALFNSVLQPILIFLQNILRSLQNLTYPFIDVLKSVSLQIAIVIRAFRLVEVHSSPRPTSEKKV
ncbi:uncharacterized protein [Ambystoma mexicanum]|uniref:uncharacterized protein isoform X1 n=1 Tax=Ambystoma mexicanum TaxID=8296 RepID=UPI0037E729A1